MGGARAGTARGGTARGGAFVFDDEHCAEIARATSGDGAFASREVAVAAYYAEKVRGKFPVVVASDALAGRANANANANANVEVLSVEAFIDAYCDGEGREIAREAYEAAVAADGADAEDAGGNAGAGDVVRRAPERGRNRRGRGGGDDRPRRASSETVRRGVRRVRRWGAHTVETRDESSDSWGLGGGGDLSRGRVARGDGDVGDARRRRPDDDDVKGSHGTSRGHHASRHAGRRGVFGCRG